MEKTLLQITLVTSKNRCPWNKLPSPKQERTWHKHPKQHQLFELVIGSGQKHMPHNVPRRSKRNALWLVSITSASEMANDQPNSMPARHSSTETVTAASCGTESPQVRGHLLPWRQWVSLDLQPLFSGQHPEESHVRLSGHRTRQETLPPTLAPSWAQSSPPVTLPWPRSTPPPELAATVPQI